MTEQIEKFGESKEERIDEDREDFLEKADQKLKLLQDGNEALLKITEAIVAVIEKLDDKQQYYEEGERHINYKPYSEVVNLIKDVKTELMPQEQKKQKEQEEQKQIANDWQSRRERIISDLQQLEEKLKLLKEEKEIEPFLIRLLPLLDKKGSSDLQKEQSRLLDLLDLEVVEYQRDDPVESINDIEIVEAIGHGRNRKVWMPVSRGYRLRATGKFVRKPKVKLEWWV